MIRSLVVASIVLAFLSSPALGLSEWGTTATGSARLCPGGLCSGTFLERVEDDQPQGSFASVEILQSTLDDHPDIFFAAEAELAGGLGVPLLRAISEADTTTRYTNGSFAEATQGYRYEGAAPQEFTLDVALSGTATGNGLISGFVGIFDVDGFDPQQTFLTRITSTNGLIDATRNEPMESLVFTLDPGQEVYVIAQLNASVDSRFSTPSTADAFSTLTTGFQSGAGLVKAVDVPEVGTAGLLAAAGLLGALRRRS